MKPGDTMSTTTKPMKRPAKPNATVPAAPVPAPESVQQPPMNWAQVWRDTIDSTPRSIRTIGIVVVVCLVAAYGKPWINAALNYLEAHQTLRNILAGLITIGTVGGVTARTVRKIKARSP